MVSPNDICPPSNATLFSFLINFLGWTSLTLLASILIVKLINKAIGSFHMCSAVSTRIKDKVVLITGASSGLGEALAYKFQTRNCKLILCSRNEQKLQELKKSLLKSYSIPDHSIPQIIPLDLEDLNSIPYVIQNCLNIYGHIDILINNAGISYRGDILSTDISVDIKLMNVNYFGHVAVIKAILPSMIERQDGHVVSIGSLQSKLALPRRSCYTASKHALQAFMECLRAEASLNSIHVLMINPGYINTNLSNNAITETGEIYGVKDKSTAQGMSPFYVAEKVMQSLLAGENEVILSNPTHKAAIWLRTMMPDIFFYLMRKRI